jgi:hypothetical protein
MKSLLKSSDAGWLKGGIILESLNDIILECSQKLRVLSGKLTVFEGMSNIKNLTSDQAILINEVSISLYFMLDKFPIIMMETLEKEELELVNGVQTTIKAIQARVSEILGINN